MLVTLFYFDKILVLFRQNTCGSLQNTAIVLFDKTSGTGNYNTN